MELRCESRILGDSVFCEVAVDLLAHFDEAMRASAEWSERALLAFRRFLAGCALMGLSTKADFSSTVDIRWLSVKGDICCLRVCLPFLGHFRDRPLSPGTARSAAPGAPSWRLLHVGARPATT